MSDVAEHSDTGTIVEWDAEEGVGVVRSDQHGRLVWIHYSMHASQGESSLWHPGVRVSIDYNATEDQDGYAWVGERVVVIDHTART